MAARIAALLASPLARLNLVLGLIVAMALAGLGLASRMPLAGAAVLGAEAAMVILFLLPLANRRIWRWLLFFFLLGLAIRGLEMLLIQSTTYFAGIPDGYDPNVWPAASGLNWGGRINPDMQFFDANARGLFQHWRGVEVVAAAFDLRGLISRGWDWPPGVSVPFATVMGTRHFLYQLYVAVIYVLTGGSQPTAVLSNAILVAALAPAAYATADRLIGSDRVSFLAAGLTLADPSFAAAGAYLLKDSLTVFITVVGILAAVRLVRDRSGYAGVCLAGSVIAMSVLRYPVTLAFWIAAIVWLVARSRQARGWPVVVVLLVSYLGSALVPMPPELGPDPQALSLVLTALLLLGLAISFGRAVQRGALAGVGLVVILAAGLYWGAAGLSGLTTFAWGNISTARGSLLTSLEERGVTAASQTPLVAASDRPAAGPVSGGSAAPTRAAAPRPPAASWPQTLRTNPAAALAKMVAHTLFAPYPWVIVTHGLSYGSFGELLYPGAVMVIVALPFAVLGIYHLPVLRLPHALLPGLWVAGIVAAYLITNGEFSERFRLLLVPVYWIVCAHGVYLSPKWCQSVRGLFRRG